MSWVHGTTSTYGNHGCRCDDCRAAHAMACFEARRRRAGRPVPEHVHGTDNGYTNYMCRCPDCREGHRVYQNERRYERRRAA